MNNEEKKAIEKLKWYFENSLSLDIAKQTYIVLNLIEKQAKEIEDKKEEIYAIAKTNYTVGMLDERNQWYKKINEKIEELNDIESNYSKKVIESPTGLITTTVQIALKELIGKEE